MYTPTASAAAQPEAPAQPKAQARAESSLLLADSPISDSQQGRWPAALALRFAPRGDATRLVENRHVGPLYVQRPFYPEGAALPHVYLLHPPGGVVSGDHLQVSIACDAEAQALITTPGATRFYRARDDAATSKQTTAPLEQRVSTHVQLDEQASLEWLPMETIVFNGAKARTHWLIELAAGAHFVAWEFVCFGLPASADWFTQGYMKQRLEVRQQGRPICLDYLAVDPEHNRHLQSPAALRGLAVSGSLLAGPFSPEQQALLLPKLRAAMAAQQAEQRVSMTMLGPILIARYLGESAAEGRGLFVELWALLRPSLLGRAVCPPRIWAT